MQKKQLTPICIASPVRRSGTTLLQRLLCSSSNTLIYGESCANDFQIFSNFLMSKTSMYESSKEWRNNQTQTVLDGNVNNWIPDLMPEINGYLTAFNESVFSLFNHYASFASRQNRSIWGMKMPEWNPSSLLMIQQLIPGTKIIYLHRNLEDCTRSAKKIDMIRGVDELRHFCHIWKQNTNYSKNHLNGKNVLHLSYEDLVEKTDECLENIHQFTGVKDIDKEVMKIKVNTYDDDPKLEGKKDAYLIPDVLSEEEMEIVNTFSIQLEQIT